MKIKRLIAITLVVCIVFIGIPTNIYGDELNSESGDNVYSVGETGGYLASNYNAIKKIILDKKFNARQGHGFAAEQGNNLSDILYGKNAEVVGNDNLLNGPDRKIVNRHGTMWIQDKYYSTASRSVNACFDETGFRYYKDGKPMQIEVPADQYDDAIIKMAEKIRQGKVQGVTNPAEASNIIKKGKLTYKQAVNITKAGNIDSLVYDAKNGVITATGAVGIGFILDFALNIINGETMEDSLKSAVMTGFKTGGTVFATYVISSQLTKTGLEKAFIPASKAIVKRFGSKFAESILTTSGMNTATMTNVRMIDKAASLIRSQAIFSIVTVAVLETGDVIEIFRGRISKEQFISNLAVTVSSVAFGVGGYYAGGALGTLIFPGPGTVVGGIVGGISTSVAGGFLADKVAKAIYAGDGALMYGIIEDELEKLASDYFITKNEALAIVESLSNKINEDELKNMYSSKDRISYVTNLLEPIFEAQIAKREKVNEPTEEEIRNELLANMEGIVFIH